MKRGIDLLLVMLAALPATLVLAVLAVLIKATSPGPVLYWSDRVGRANRLFRMPKLRSMRTGTPELATHLLASPDVFLTPVGSFLRQTSLDELPQLWCILTGEMTLVGPRPALFNQGDLIALRTAKGIERLTPGLTGWAQINGRDEIPVARKVEFDEFYLHNHSLRLDMLILWRTITKVLAGEGVSH